MIQNSVVFGKFPAGSSEKNSFLEDNSYNKKYKKFRKVFEKRPAHLKINIAHQSAKKNIIDDKFQFH